jgi:hypothetical protein
MRGLILILLPLLHGCQSLGVLDLASRALDKCASVSTISTRGGRWYESPDFSATCRAYPSPPAPEGIHHVPTP